MGVATLISLDEYLATSYRPDCDFIDGEVLERNVGKKKHAYAQSAIVLWLGRNTDMSRVHPFTEARMRVSRTRVRIPDVILVERPFPDEEVFTAAPYLCIEVLSPDDTTRTMQARLDDYLDIGVPNIWVVDPWSHRGWRITATSWEPASDGILRTSDGKIQMPLAEVLLA